MPLLGIARVTEITRMDRLGLPVYASIRPRGRTLRVHAGKGLTRGEARTGALMEAIEYAVAERHSLRGPDGIVPLESLLVQWPAGMRLLDFAPRIGARISTVATVGVVRCEHLGHRESVFLPAELVLVPYDRRGEPALFGWSTNGLASGNSLDEATLHGLLEILERDALAIDKARNLSARIPSSDLPAPFRRWASEWMQMGVELIVRSIPNAFGLPCFEAHLHDPASFEIDLSRGSGLHPDIEIALARAVCEAAQSRLSFIHGGRDDIADFYRRSSGRVLASRRKAKRERLAALKSSERTIGWTALSPASVAGQAPGAVLARILASLAERGFPHVFRRRMNADETESLSKGFHVVKVVVPRCEVIENGCARAGPRLMANVLQRG